MDWKCLRSLEQFPYLWTGKHSIYVLKGMLVHPVMMDSSIHDVNRVEVALIIMASLCGKALA